MTRAWITPPKSEEQLARCCDIHRCTPAELAELQWRLRREEAAKLTRYVMLPALTHMFEQRVSMRAEEGRAA